MRLVETGSRARALFTSYRHRNGQETSVLTSPPNYLILPVNEICPKQSYVHGGLLGLDDLRLSCVVMESK